MRSVRLNFLSMFFLVFGFSYQGYADCPWNVKSNTELEAGGSKVGKGIANFFSGKWNDLDFDEKLLQYIKVKAIKDQGVGGYFDPKIQVCDYEGKNNCYILPSGTSCRQIYGTQSTGGGVSTAVFIDWEGDKMLSNGTIKEKDNGEIKGGIAKGLRWEWADGVTDEEKSKFVNSPKICACSQKGACMSGISSWGARVFSGENIFYPGDMDKACDTCYQKVVKCAPVPLAPSPPPFCEQVAMSPPQVRIVPITNKDNDYFDPKVKVIAGDLIEEDGKIGKRLGFPRKYGESEAEWHPISDKDGTTHYFKTYRKKDQLCVEYRGTEREESKGKLQFPARCFPTPPAPEPEVVEIVQSNTPREQSDTLKIRMKMNRETCNSLNDRAYSDGFCTFSVNTGSPTNVGPLSLKVVKPKIIEKTTEDDKKESNITDIIEGILESNPQFKILREYGYVPDTEFRCSSSGNFYSLSDLKLENKSMQCEFNHSGQPEIEVKYKDNSKSKMLCLSGWQPEPEGSVLKKENEIIPLKLMGASYAKYNAVYSKESNQFYYFPCNETIDILAEPQSKLDEIIFNKRGYVFIPDENKDRDNCLATKDKEIDTKQNCDKCKIVYKLIDGKREEKSCNQGDDGCLCFNRGCNRPTQYLKDGEPFYLRYEEVNCRDEDGKTLKNEKGEIQKCTQLKDQPIKANRTEVFYADKLCGFDLKGLKNRLREIIVARLENKKRKLEEKDQGSYDLGDGYTDDLSQYDYVEIEAWGGGEAGHIKNTAHSTESRPGMPGDYIKAKLRIDPSHPIIKVEVKQGGGKREQFKSDKNGGSTTIKMCDSNKQNCQPLITVAGGGKYKEYGEKSYKDTIIHAQSLKLEEKVIQGNEQQSTQDNQIAYIEDGQIKYKNVGECREGYVDGEHGAGGCINTNGTNKVYGRGSLGYVKIKPMFGEIDESKINAAVDEMVDNLKDITIDDSLINKLDEKIIGTIKEEIRKELLGSQSEDSKS